VLEDASEQEGAHKGATTDLCDVSWMNEKYIIKIF